MQNKTKFNPTAEQVAFANAYVKYKGNITKACREVGDRYRNIYYGPGTGWHYQEGFDEWLSDYAKTEVLKRWGKWYLILEKYAEEGSFQHLNTLLQIGKQFNPKTGMEWPGVLNVVYDYYSDEDLIKEATQRGCNIPPEIQRRYEDSDGVKIKKEV